MNDETSSFASPEDRFRAAQPAEIVQVAEVVDEVVAEPRTPWGFWATVGLSGVVLAVFVAIQTAVVIPFALVEIRRQPRASVQALTESLESNGLLLALATTLSAPACIGLSLLFARLRRGISVRQYLGLKPVAKRSVLFWCSCVVLFGLVSDGLAYLAGREVVPQQMTRAYQTAGFLPLFWLAIVCLAPLSEEIFFRGFLFSGLRHSRLGGLLAILITALVWAGIHMQYDAHQVRTIFVGGLLLGTARLRTDSVYLTIGMHVIWNLIAMVETAIVVSW